MCAVGTHHYLPVSASTRQEMAADTFYCRRHTDVELKLKLNFFADPSECYSLIRIPHLMSCKTDLKVEVSRTISDAARTIVSKY